MAAEISTIQSLKAVDAWIDVINANINGGVRTAFKASRLKFGGSNTDVSRPGSATSLPLQFPEPGLTTVNTVIDFSQGAITASTENSHLAIQGDGFFQVVDPGSVNADGTLKAATAASRIYLTRDGEFRTNQNGLLVNSAGYFLVTQRFAAPGVQQWTSGVFGAACSMRCVYNNVDSPANATVATNALRLTDFLQGLVSTGTLLADGVTALPANTGACVDVTLGAQSLKYTTLGSTVFDMGYVFNTGGCDPSIGTNFAATTDFTILSKSLEASNASMTQSVPELSLAQKLFSALTKVLQTKQTNVDGVLNLVR
jgi:flagellar hook protein FlgE